MVPPAGSKKDERIPVILRIPRDLVEALDLAIKLGYFPNAKSRNQTITELIRNELANILFVINAYERAQKLAKQKYKKTGVPPELAQIQLATELITTAPGVEDVTNRFFLLIANTSANAKRPEFKELKAKLEKVLAQTEVAKDGVDENEL